MATPASPETPPPGTWEPGLTFTGAPGGSQGPEGIQAAVPAICEQCGKVFPSGIQIGGGITATVSRFGEARYMRPCPACGLVGAAILPGTWTVDTIISFLRMSAAERQAIQDVVKVAVAEGVEAGLKAAERLAPKTRDIVKDAILSPHQKLLLKFLGYVLTATGLLYAHAWSDIGQGLNGAVERVIESVYAGPTAHKPSSANPSSAVTTHLPGQQKLVCRSPDQVFYEGTCECKRKGIAVRYRATSAEPPPSLIQPCPGCRKPVTFFRVSQRGDPPSS